MWTTGSARHRRAVIERLVRTSDVYTTKLRNAHGTEFREVLYRWHPWFGRRVAVHEAVSRSDGIIFRCTLTGGSGRQLELPAWMFDSGCLW